MHFNKMEAKANKMLDEANAMAELNASAEDSNIDNLAAKYENTRTIVYSGSGLIKRLRKAAVL